MASALHLHDRGLRKAVIVVFSPAIAGDGPAITSFDSDFGRQAFCMPAEVTVLVPNHVQLRHVLAALVPTDTCSLHARHEVAVIAACAVNDAAAELRVQSGMVVAGHNNAALAVPEEEHPFGCIQQLTPFVRNKIVQL